MIDMKFQFETAFNSYIKFFYDFHTSVFINFIGLPHLDG